MKFEMKMRRIKESDIRAECPFLPDPDDYEMYLDSLVDDIKSLEFIRHVERVEDVISFKVKDGINEEVIRHKIKPFITDERSCQYRVVEMKRS